MNDRERSVDAPRLAGWLLRRVLTKEAAEAVLGDLVEEAATSTDRHVSSWPRLWIVWQSLLHLIAIRSARRHERRHERRYERRRESNTRYGLNPNPSSRRSSRRLDEFIQDTRYAWRLCVRAPMFAVVVVMTLALGIGLNTAVFSVVNAVLVRPLDYPHPERLVWIAPANARGRDDVVMAPDFEAWRDRATTVDRVAGYMTGAEAIDVGDDVLQARVAAVTDEFWELTGATFALGGPPAAGQEGVVLPHAFFERWFRGRASIIGQPVTINGQQTVITGVLPADFRPQLVSSPVFVTTTVVGGDIDVYRAEVIRPAEGPAIQVMSVMGRLKPGVSIERAQAELESLRQQPRSPGPGPGPRMGMGKPSRLRVLPYADKLVGDARRPLLILQAAVVLVLLIVCVNTANLLLVRGWMRQREIAIRSALGAGRGRVLRQFFVESLMLGIAGCAAGLLVAYGLTATLVRLLPMAVPRLSETTIDVRVLLFALGACAVTIVVFASVPAIAQWKNNISDTLKDAARSSSSSTWSVRVRSALVALEVALTVVLLVAAGLMVKSFWHMTAYPAGFAPDRVLTMRVQFSGPRYGEPRNQQAFIDELIRRAAAAPGVEAAGVGSNGGGFMLLTIEGEPDRPPDQKKRGVLSVVSEGYAAALGLRLVKGRWLTDREPAPVFVINESLARQAFPGVDPIGKRLRIPFVDPQAPMPASGPPAPRFGEIVGVVADLRYSKLGVAAEPELFMDYAHARMGGTTLTVRTSGDPMAIASSLRTLLSSVDRTLPLFDVKPLDVVLADSIAPRRLTLLLLGTFAAAALILVIIGIYGLVSYAVAQRTQEIGVRIALGATRRRVVMMVLTQSMAITIGGIALGLASAVLSTHLMTAVLYEVTPTDVATFVVAAITILGTALAACVAPALKASLVDPLVALRCE
jgi:putative ABC transport system permease protein